MTLVASGTLHMIGSATPSESINYELYGDYTGPLNLTDAGTEAGFSTPVSITDFYGYSHCEAPNVPYGVVASWIMTGVISITFNVTGDYDGIDFQQSTNNVDWYTLQFGYTGSSPFSTTTSCSYTWFRCRAYKDCGESSSWGSSYNAGSCP